MKELHFSVFFLPNLGGVRSQCAAIREEGIVGFSHLPGQQGECALHWRTPHQAERVDRSTSGGAQPFSQGSDLGPLGVVGYRSNPERGCRAEAAFWSALPELPTTLLHPASLLGARGASCALGIDRATQRIVGSGHGEETEQRRIALAWLEPLAACAHRIHPAAILGTDSSSHAQRAAEGWIVGYGRGSRTDQSDHALLWHEPSTADCVLLHPQALLGQQSRSFASNTAGGCVVGYGQGTETGHQTQALCWPRPSHESAVLLHPEWLFGPRSQSWAFATEGGWTVGAGCRATTPHQSRALLWTAPHSRAVVDLHTYAPPLAQSSRAYGVAANGVIVGAIDHQAALWVPS